MAFAQKNVLGKNVFPSSRNDSAVTKNNSVLPKIILLKNVFVGSKNVFVENGYLVFSENIKLGDRRTNRNQSLQCFAFKQWSVFMLRAFLNLLNRWIVL